MRFKKFFHFISGFVLCLGIVGGCASTPSFPWRYYAPSMPNSCYDQGALLGALGSNGWPDLALDTCKPDSEPSPGASPSVTPVRLKCMILKVDDFYALKADDLKCHADLKICQAGPNPARDE